ncbi:MAG: ubiquinone/menaquinone biosynthesis methyltransferase [Armatimonadetes bacterium]|nr:ubiquinone/menaquinone biosynthesis methyltransferase [Armatimonadota bacterium]
MLSSTRFVDHRRGITAMFARIASRYDCLNDVLSFGLHRVARAVFLRMLAPREGSLMLDVCAGTGALSRLLVARGCRVVMLDACPEMLSTARKRQVPAAMVVGDALAMPFPNGAFDTAIVGFALRNVASVEQLLREMRRVVRPGGRVGCLEFTQPNRLLRPLFHAYLEVAVRAIGRLVDAPAYDYLARSVRRVIDAETVVETMRRVGLRHISVTRVMLGTAACFVGEV